METLKKNLTKVMLILITASFFSFDLPSGWFKAGSEPKSYDMGVDKGAGKHGRNAATIKSNRPDITGFGTLMQDCSPNTFLAKRVRMSGYVKLKDVTNWAGLWLRIDQNGSQQSLGFDNMHDGKTDRSLKGTVEWKKYEIVLDVPVEASNIAYGALLVGSGQIWFDNLKFEIVDKTVPVTGIGKEITRTKEPVNLDFED